ncbi:type III-B CRISPR module-associated protein Cmr5 [Peptococcaceae bacterium 1198_IL3148]
MNSIRTLDQKRAENALEIVNQLLEKANNNPSQQEWNDKYASYVKGLPATILMNGLGQAAATLLAAADGNKTDAHNVLYSHLQSWLCRNDETAPYLGGKDLLSQITTKDRNSYLRAQAEALSWLTWLKKFAVAYLKKPDGGAE